MIDGVQLTYFTPDPKTQLLDLGIWEVVINEKSRLMVNEIRSASFRALDLKLKPSVYRGYNLLINGSLHKFHNFGLYNHDSFTFEKLLQAVDSLINSLGLDPYKCILHGLEIGLNIELPYSPLKVLKNLVCFRSHPFTQINKRNARMGFQCTFSQYRIKVYDKGQQSGIDCGNILRFEVSVEKMQFIEKYGISTLSNLQDREKVYPLVNILCEAFKGIIWTDTTVNMNRLTQREQKQWLYYSNPKTWEQLSKHQRSRGIKQWNTLLSKYGEPPNLLPVILQTWESLFVGKTEAEKPRPFYLAEPKSEAVGKATFLPLVCTVKGSNRVGAKSLTVITGYSINKKLNVSSDKDCKSTSNFRTCMSCGNDISSQRQGSRFCSEQSRGRLGKKCRNVHSNRRRTHKLKITNAIKRDVYIVIGYSDSLGNCFSDVLHSSELSISANWFDAIKTITPVNKLSFTK